MLLRLSVSGRWVRLLFWVELLMNCGFSRYLRLEGFGMCLIVLISLVLLIRNRY